VSHRLLASRVMPLVRSLQMSQQDRGLEAAKAVLLAEIRGRLVGRDHPLLVALDGASEVGKSVLTALVAPELGATVIHGDDFFAAGITEAEWDARTPAAKAADAIDWRRMRADVIEPLLAGQTASYHPFDFEAGVNAEGAYSMSSRLIVLRPAHVILLEGAYASRPELSDVIDLSVLVDAPVAVRHRRLARREERTFLDAWHRRWDASEEHYFGHVRPRSSFDLVLTNAGPERE
jgi:uridine kinase